MIIHPYLFLVYSKWLDNEFDVRGAYKKTEIHSAGRLKENLFVIRSAEFLLICLLLLLQMNNWSKRLVDEGDGMTGMCGLHEVMHLNTMTATSTFVAATVGCLVIVWNHVIITTIPVIKLLFLVDKILLLLVRYSAGLQHYRTLGVFIVEPSPAELGS